MNAIIAKLIRHALTTFGGATMATDDHVNQIVGILSMLIGVAWSLAESRKQKAPTIKPIPPVPPAIGLAIISAVLAGCITAPGDKKSQRWEQVSYVAGYGGTVSWIIKHPGDRETFERVAAELRPVSERDIVLISDFLIIAKQLPIRELRENASVAIVTDAVVMLADANGAIAGDDVQLYLRPITRGLWKGIEAGLSRTSNRN